MNKNKDDGIDALEREPPKGTTTRLSKVRVGVIGGSGRVDLEGKRPSMGWMFDVGAITFRSASCPDAKHVAPPPPNPRPSVLLVSLFRIKKN